MQVGPGPEGLVVVQVVSSRAKNRNEDSYLSLQRSIHATILLTADGHVTLVEGILPPGSLSFFSLNQGLTLSLTLWSMPSVRN